MVTVNVVSMLYLHMSRPETCLQPLQFNRTALLQDIYSRFLAVSRAMI